ncbi:hypothetical protein BDN67DRAFT_981412 [Paxillus ammoniavirescens]|nr:hypothetical protein BDN67DRAFT_981412 [Paxillus ammoniavirescens]
MTPGPASSVLRKTYLISLPHANSMSFLVPVDGLLMMTLIADANPKRNPKIATSIEWNLDASPSHPRTSSGASVNQNSSAASKRKREIINKQRLNKEWFRSAPGVEDEMYDDGDPMSMQDLGRLVVSRVHLGILHQAGQYTGSLTYEPTELGTFLWEEPGVGDRSFSPPLLGTDSIYTPAVRHDAAANGRVAAFRGNSHGNEVATPDSRYSSLRWQATWSMMSGARCAFLSNGSTRFSLAACILAHSLAKTIGHGCSRLRHRDRKVDNALRKK